MKKRLIFALAITAMFYSCDKDDSIEETEITQSTSQNKGYVIESTGDYIGAGYGFNPAGNEGRPYQTPFDRDLIVINNDLPDDFNQRVNGNFAAIETVEDFYEYAKRVRGLDDAYVNTGYFSVNVDRDADILSSTKLNEDFISVIVTVDAVNRRYDVAGNPDFDQLNASGQEVAAYPDRFRERFGDFYVSSEIIGGSISIVYTWKRSDLTETQKSTVKTGFGLKVLGVFGIGGSSTVNKEEIKNLINKTENVNVISTVSAFAPAFGKDSNIDTFNTELNRFISYLRSNPADNDILYQQISNYSPYIQTGAFNDNPSVGRECVKLNNQWTYVYDVMSLIDSNTSPSDPNKANIQALRNEALNNVAQARECVAGNLPSYVNSTRYTVYFEFYEINKRAKEMTRFYDKVAKTYFYTADENEKNNLRADSGRYNEEGRAYYILDSAIPDKATVPLYRFSNVNGSSGTYFYTTNKTNGETYFGATHGIAGYIYSESSDNGSVPLHRYRNADTYLYTTDAPGDTNGEGYSAIQNYGYSHEGVSGYVFK